MHKLLLIQVQVIISYDVLVLDFSIFTAVEMFSSISFLVCSLNMSSASCKRKILHSEEMTIGYRIEIFGIKCATV